MKKLIKAMSIIFIMAIFMFCTTTVQAASKKLSAPKNIKATISGTSNVKLTWSKVKNSSKYTIYRATSKSGKYTKVGTTKSTSYTDKKTSRGKTYYYKVVANNKNSKLNSSKSAAVKVTVPSKAKALKEIKKALKDTKWVNKNLKIKKNVFGEKVSSKSRQQFSFVKIKGKELVLVNTLCAEEYSTQGFLVGYYNGKVTVKALTKYPGHCNHGGIVVDEKNGMVGDVYMHQGYETATFYKISDVKFTKKAQFQDNIESGEEPVVYMLNGKKVSASKFGKEANKYLKYKYNAITRSLTSKNIDKYVK